MYKPRKNFLDYSVPSVEHKKAEAKKILSSLFEKFSVDELNSLYQPEEPVKAQAAPTPLKMDQPAAAGNLQPVSDTLITVGKLPFDDDDRVVVDVKKPIKVVFRDSTGGQENPLKEETAILDEPEVKEDPYDFLSSAPPLDLSADLQNVVASKGQGMMGNIQITPGFALQKETAPGMDAIQSIEDDPYGMSVVGLDNDIGMNML